MLALHWESMENELFSEWTDYRKNLWVKVSDASAWTQYITSNQWSQWVQATIRSYTGANYGSPFVTALTSLSTERQITHHCSLKGAPCQMQPTGLTLSMTFMHPANIWYRPGAGTMLASIGPLSSNVYWHKQHFRFYIVQILRKYDIENEQAFIAWLIDRMIDWLIFLLFIDWQTSRATDWLFPWLTNWLIDRLNNIAK